MRSDRDPIPTAVRTPLVSIGMPVRNGARSVGAALRSLMAQSYANIEIVVCDNASDDGTAAVAEAFARDDPRIVVRRFDEGVDIRRSFERALESRRGEYFLFAPADDFWDPGFIAAAVAEMEKRPSLSVCSGVVTMDRGEPPARLIRYDEITGAPRERWIAAMIETGSQLRIYGLLRNAGLDGLFPPEGPEGWDHFPVCKLALRGDLGFIDHPSITRLQTPWTKYRENVHAQETGMLRTAFFFRRVVRLFATDREFAPLGLRGRLALWHRTLRFARGLGAPYGAARFKFAVGLVFRLVETLLGRVAIDDRGRQ